MEEIKTSGGKQFMIVMVWMIALYMLCGTVMSMLYDYAWIGGVGAVIIFSVFGYFVLTHYTARFTYSLTDGRLRINRLIGKRNREVEFGLDCVVGMSYGKKPDGFVKRPLNMRVSIISQKHSLYIEYKDKDGTVKGVVIEPSDKLRGQIELERK